MTVLNGNDNVVVFAPTISCRVVAVALPPVAMPVKIAAIVETVTVVNVDCVVSCDTNDGVTVVDNNVVVSCFVGVKAVVVFIAVTAVVTIVRMDVAVVVVVVLLNGASVGMYGYCGHVLMDNGGPSIESNT